MLTPNKTLSRRVAGIAASVLLLLTATTACGGSDAEEPIIFSGTGQAVPAGD